MLFFFFNDTATTEIYTLSLHDALPIWCTAALPARSTASLTRSAARSTRTEPASFRTARDRKSTRLNSSHSQISYAVFCLKKKDHPPESRRQLHSYHPTDRDSPHQLCCI